MSFEEIQKHLNNNPKTNAEMLAELEERKNREIDSYNNINKNINNNNEPEFGD